ncbi:hypothetical protein CW731_14680 [Polaribacter sp. ALD11]|uniref:hypothetical protein n=1 Tax=Polaribacter sp. ALD11 TaxID=2058137 RepID=UPI000C3056F7|nr:hypothetical protein [Polaribacter sp. ALD11]AUC86448.1 hypothetical protein CW731_14680 [Polaribacter sp. ALD11]
MKFLKNVFPLLCTILFFSCSQTLDFDQLDGYTIKPTISTSLTFFTIDAASFATAVGVPIITEISEKSDFKLFENSFIKQNLIQLDFDIEVRNEFNRDFTIEILLLDEDDTIIYTFNAFLGLKVAANNLNFKHKEVIDIEANQNVKNFTRVEIKLSLDDKFTPLDILDVGRIKFKSAATIYLEAPL